MSTTDSGPGTLSMYASIFKRFKEWMAKHHPTITLLRDVPTEVAQSYAEYLGKNFTPNTFNKHRNLLTLVWRVLKDKADIEQNPWEGIARKRLDTQTRREFTTDELRRICEAAEGELKLLFTLGIYTGLRRGDCCTLKWAEVDLGRNVIMRIPNKTASNGEPVLVPIHPVLGTMLNERPAKKRAGYVLTNIARDYNEKPPRISKLIRKHFESCGIDTKRELKGKKGARKVSVVDVGFHSLRHSFVSLCRESGAPMSVVEQIVGHSNPAMTRHYTHVSELAAKNAVQSLPSVLADYEEALEEPNSHIQKAIEILEGSSQKNWKNCRDEAIDVLRLTLEPST